MNQSEKEAFLVKVQEIEAKIRELRYWFASLSTTEPTLFADNSIAEPTPESTVRKPRQKTEDGSLTASSIAHRLSKELGRKIPRERIILLGKQIEAKAVYCERQHISRYPADSAKKIMDLYRTFNQL